MIVVTGAAGFIGSCLVRKLNDEGFKDIVAVDDFSREEKNRNLIGKELTEKVERNTFFDWLEAHHKRVQFIFHIGARTDTTEFDKSIFDTLNLNYSKKVWELCHRYGLPLVYASSAATYGGGEHGYSDDHALIDLLRPLNPYGESKHEFDKWAVSREDQPYFWAGLKFFNVYGPNEYHKGRMASVVYHSFNQIKQNGALRLFRSHRSDYEDGKQLRDFVYVKDVVDVCFFLMHHRKDSGIYNLGSGKARTFLDLAGKIFETLGKPRKVEFIDTPADIREKYQYFTEADMGKLRRIGYSKPFHTLEEGVEDYISGYLSGKIYF
jgi:ADP-L-glycero-D-manno-heptose 6-epimerase